MDKQFKRILDLVRRTGDRMIVTDPDGKEAFVVMDLGSYESLLDAQDLAMNEFVAEAANAPIPTAFDSGEDDGPPADIWDAMPPAGSKAETWNLGGMPAEDRHNIARQYQQFQAQKAAAPKPEQKIAEETQKIEKPKPEDFGEEQFYLEPIE
jgi:hypothetical protein